MARSIVNRFVRPTALLVVVGMIATTAGFFNSSGDQSPSPTPTTSIDSLAKLIEGDCFELKSFEWARRSYLAERAACVGEITQRSIEDCRANVVSVHWDVPTTDGSSPLKVAYFFDEVAQPARERAGCIVDVPTNLESFVRPAARIAAKNGRLVGPFKAGQGGFSTPFLTEYWTDDIGRPKFGIIHLPLEPDAHDSPSEKMTEYPWIIVGYSGKAPIRNFPDLRSQSTRITDH